MNFDVQNEVGIGVFDLFDARPGVRAFVTTRHGGESTGPYATLNLGKRTDDDPAVVDRNRERVAALAGVRSPALVFARQVHGARVARVPERHAGAAFADTDALVSDAPGTPLVILTADCAAVFLFDPVRRAIGIAHAGWRGTVAGIASATVACMADAFGTRPGDLVAGVGPSIGPCCYEVGNEVIDAVQSLPPGLTDDVLVAPDMASAGSFRGSVNEERAHFDLWRANELQLLAAGVRAENLEIAGVCTACRTDLFYSHRAEQGVTGRFAGVIVLRDPA